eukprot:358407-Amphidinium_carterae.2
MKVEICGDPAAMHRWTETPTIQLFSRSACENGNLKQRLLSLSPGLTPQPSTNKQYDCSLFVLSKLLADGDPVLTSPGLG